MVKCINKEPGMDLTVGRTYQIISRNPGAVKIKNDAGAVRMYSKIRFVEVV